MSFLFGILLGFRLQTAWAAWVLGLPAWQGLIKRLKERVGVLSTIEGY